MSKFLPMFKKKGKGKEEDLIDETKKKRSKPHKLTKEILSSPSSSGAPKAEKEKKRKTTKRKAPTPHGKENYPSVAELEKEFFIDESGNVRECPTELYIDSLGAVREGPRELFIDNALTVDEPNPETVSDTSHKERRENVSAHGGSRETHRLSASSDGLCTFTSPENSFEDPETKEHESLSERSIEVTDGNGEEMMCVRSEAKEEERVVLRNSSARQAEKDTSISAKIASRLSVSEELHYWQEEEAAILECEPVTDSTVEEMQKEPEVTENKVPEESICEVVESMDESANVPVVTTPDISDDCITITMDGKCTVTEVEVVVHEEVVVEERALSVAHEDSLVDTSCTNTGDSDDDFDSAKEDWDDESDEKESKETDHSESLQREDDFEMSSGSEGITEAENMEMKEKYEEQCTRQHSTTSSIYQDAHSREDSLYDIKSIVEATNEDQSYVEGNHGECVQAERLTRKISNVSACSSDVFNEELDDLLNEELDRLSEEETATGNNMENSTVETENKVKSEVSEEECSGLETQQQIGTQEIRSEESCTESSKVPLTTTPPPTTTVEESVTPIETNDASDDDDDDDDDDECSGDTRMTSPSHEHQSQICISPTAKHNADDGDNERSENTLAEESVTSQTQQQQQQQREAKDSGYYSLPPPPPPSPPASPKATCTVIPSESEQAATPQQPPPLESSPNTAKDDRHLPSTTDTMTVSTSVLETPEVQSPEVEGLPTDQADVSGGMPTVLPSQPEDTARTASPNEDEGSRVLVADETKVNADMTEAKESSVILADRNNHNTSLTEESRVPVPDRTKVNSDTPPLKLEVRKRNSFDRLRSPPADGKGAATSPMLGGSVLGRHARLKSPGVGCEGGGGGGGDNVISADPVGDLFLRQAVCLSHEEAEARLAQRRAARAEARELRLRELERQQHEQENEEEKQFSSPSYTESVPRAGLGRTGGRSSGMNCTGGGGGGGGSGGSGGGGGGGQYSRRSSEDSTTDEATLPPNVREMRAELKELDEKFRKAMITNAQLDNEKATLTFEVELMKDRYTELEEAHTQLTKEHRKKCTEYEQLKKVSTKLQEEVKILRSMLQERDQLIQEYGLVIMGEEENGEDGDHAEEEDDDVDDLSPRKLSVKKVLVSQEAADLLSKGAAKGSLDVRLKKFGEEKNDLEDQVRRLKLELEEERNNNRRRENGLDYEKQKKQSKTVNEYKFRAQKAEAEASTLQANVVRLDALLTRYKSQSEELETSEEELKQEKRKLQRELRDAQSRIEELETTNNHLKKRFDKIKNARSNLLKDLSQEPA